MNDLANVTSPLGCVFRFQQMDVRPCQPGELVYTPWWSRWNSDYRMTHSSISINNSILLLRKYHLWSKQLKLNPSTSVDGPSVDELSARVV